MTKFIALVGTNFQRSTGSFASIHAEAFADKAEIELVGIQDIPLFNKPADKQVPEIVKEIVAKIDVRLMGLISTPEYDHAIPAVL